MFIFFISVSLGFYIKYTRISFEHVLFVLVDYCTISSWFISDGYWIMSQTYIIVREIVLTMDSPSLGS